MRQNKLIQDPNNTNIYYIPGAVDKNTNSECTLETTELFKEKF